MSRLNDNDKQTDHTAVTSDVMAGIAISTNKNILYTQSRPYQLTYEYS